MLYTCVPVRFRCVVARHVAIYVQLSRLQFAWVECTYQDRPDTTTASVAALAGSEVAKGPKDTIPRNLWDASLSPSVRP